VSEGEDFLLARGITAETAVAFELGWDERRRAISIPFFDALGRERIVRYRCLGSGAKYLTDAGSQHHLYNVIDADKSPVYLTEGEFDCMILKQMGLNAVGVPGVNGFKAQWAWLFQDADVFIAFDGDEAGHKGALSLARVLSPHVAGLVVVDMPEGKDINDCYLDGTLKQVLGL
jgi:DNA primase